MQAIRTRNRETQETRQPAYQRLCDMGREARRNLDTGRWIIGDLALEVDSAYGKNRIRDFANEIGALVSSVKQYRSVSRFYEKDTRVAFLELANIGYSHMRLAMRLKTLKAASAFLFECADNDWTVERAIVAMNERIGKPTPPLKLLDIEATVLRVQVEHVTAAVLVIEAAPGADKQKVLDVVGQHVRVVIHESEAL